MNSSRAVARLIQTGIASLALGVLAYDALLWFPLGLDHAQVLMRVLLGVSGIGAICIACGAAMKAVALPARSCLTWGSWVVAGGVLFAMVAPVSAFVVPLAAALVSGLLLIVIGGFRLATAADGFSASSRRSDS